MAKKTETKELSFEAARERLEQLANELDSGELKLEDAIKKYEEGVKLYASCQEILAKAEKKVQLLVRDGSGALKSVPFDSEETETEAAPGDKDSSEASASKGQGTRSKKVDLF